MSDYLVRGMSMDGFVKAVAIRSTELVSRGAQIQGTTPNATAAFGRVLTAASMMGNMQKVENGSLTLQVRGGGPIGTITVVSDATGNVRGCVTEPKVPLVEKYRGKLDVGATVGTDGTLTVIRDLQMKEPYVGSIPLVSGEIGDDVTAYFAKSEQIPRSPQTWPRISSGVIPCSSIGVTAPARWMPRSKASMVSSGAPGRSCRMYPPATFTDASRSTSTPRAQAVGVCSLWAK